MLLLLLDYGMYTVDYMHRPIIGLIENVSYGNLKGKILDLSWAQVDPSAYVHGEKVACALLKV